ncbi:MAG TPA: protein phosphatase 2C domain-containing protein [Spirochaetota bacterium]|nr:protein phosphatase 2C domain-containing protein [Spirochaetota bacterium]HPF06883.1 protein phosphatase 2C domain-containing protein [Spirochaetota bacterium]HPJ43615.1 protein phosphatase 2C domain-containing protein [Spirochaetota bacterium]HPR38669.1 protein phosphatase 2C domain-containing protein [Spirochaetota bacterium]HRX49212.1 protein phosphatase 2C domain-containing protein [Spirochaetota bacterium]
MKIEYCCITDKGTVRQTNEDSILCNGSIVTFRDHYESPEVVSKDVGEDVVCFSVADGMGGHEAGEIASLLTLEKLSEQIKKNGVSLLNETDLLKGVIEKIHREITDFGSRSGKKAMGTTLVGAILNASKFIVFNVGDSRLYTFRDGYLAQKTRDHSLAEQMGGNVPKNYITSSIGGGIENITIDIYDLTGKVRENDLVMICSDGLTDIDMDKYYDDIEGIIKSNTGDLKKINSELLNFSLSHGSADNVSIVTVRIC